MTSNIIISQKLEALHPKPINVWNCSLKSSIVERLSNNNQHNKQRFDLGNGQIFNDPIHAASYLLQREYGESSIFELDKHDPVFIPPIFTSTKKSFKIEAIFQDQLKSIANNLQRDQPNYWFTIELKAFVCVIEANKDIGISKAKFGSWILNIKIMYLLSDYSKESFVHIESKSTCDVQTFLASCFSYLPLNDTLRYLLEELSKEDDVNNVLKMVDNLLGKTSLVEDPALKWLFEMQFSDIRGENIEEWFIDQLWEMEMNDILREIVILNLANINSGSDKKVKEFDLFIISWSRKLIINVNVKRKLSENVFEQFEKSHKFLEEQLGDQLGAGWIFFPVVCVGKNIAELSSPDHHHITMNTCLKTWLENVIKNFPLVQDTESLGQLRNALKFIIFPMHMSKKYIPSQTKISCWSEHIKSAYESISHSDSLLFYSKLQLSILNSDHSRLIIISPGFGAGETILLREKAMLLAKQNDHLSGKVMYVESNTMKDAISSESTLTLRKSGVMVEFMRPDLFRLILQNKSKAVFLDEYMINKDSDIYLLDQLAKYLEVLWVVPSSESFLVNFKEKLETNFEILDVSLNFGDGKAEPEKKKFEGNPEIEVFTEYQSNENKKKDDVKQMKKDISKVSKELNDAKSSAERTKNAVLEDSNAVLESFMNTVIHMTSVLSLIKMPSKGDESTQNLSSFASQQFKDIDNQVKKNQKEVDQLNNTIVNVSQNLASVDMRHQLHENTSFTGHMIWKIDNLEHRFTQAIIGRTTALHSAPCYITKYGYKFCARLYLTGDGLGKGTHASLYFVLMKSEFDVLLEWPFKKHITFTLINQDNTERNIVETFNTDVNSSSFKRPTKQMNIASGCPYFAKQDKLRKPELGFVKDGCIYIDINVRNQAN
eukprot:TCONS_00012888-protein